MQIQVGAVPQFPGYPQRSGVAGVGDANDFYITGTITNPLPTGGCAAGLRLDPTGTTCIPEGSPVFQNPVPLPPVPVTTLNNASWCGQGLVYDPADGSCNPLALPPASIPSWVWAVAAGLIGLGLMGGGRR